MISRRDRFMGSEPFWNCSGSAPLWQAQNNWYRVLSAFIISPGMVRISTPDEDEAEAIAEDLIAAFTLSDGAVPTPDLIKARIT